MRNCKLDAVNYRCHSFCLLYLLLLLLFSVSSVMASEIGDEIEGVITDEEESLSFFKKDWRIDLQYHGCSPCKALVLCS